MTRRRTRPIPRRGEYAAALLAGIVLLAAAGELLAVPGALRVSEAPMGEYRVSVWTDPTPVRPGQLEVSVLVVRPGVEGVEEGAEVRVEAHSAGARHQQVATREQAMDPRYYAARLPVEGEGAWEIEVSVRGEHGEGRAAFEVTARERGWIAHPLTLTFLALLPLALLIYWAFREPEAVEVS